MVLTIIQAIRTKKQRILEDTLLYNQIKIKLYLDLNLNTAGELELHQSVNSLSS
ncbi:hypothetical protein SAMN04488494_2769 [Xylanibacter ruminicola]|uniref:Uncharacterized protein n=1 Tax=Xylanibacter ruminicola TaxID=839 RepID=A0A1M7M5D6_XYLRU|nr:hypothetical protein SAMN04488493_104152 [Xylanibacter ruminicola]SHM85812.1 hypothetical protein SAMN04488494_2769 [Xylanibacter ruminicola]